jgi:D-sedoheptulose 7-phosphate isomerase
LPSIALSTNSSIVTAIGNDYGFNHIFRRQIEALCQPGDVVVGISTSGKSRSDSASLETARDLGAHTVAFTGQDGGSLAGIAHEALRILSTETPRIQIEMCVHEYDLASAEVNPQ